MWWLAWPQDSSSFHLPPIMRSLKTQWLIQLLSARSLSCNSFVSEINLAILHFTVQFSPNFTFVEGGLMDLCLINGTIENEGEKLFLDRGDNFQWGDEAGGDGS